MNTIVGGALAALLLSTQAQAISMYCAFDQKNGQVVKYGFAETADDPNAVREIAFMRNGGLTLHPPEKQPLWSVIEIGDGIIMRYRKDPRFTISVPPQGVVMRKGLGLKDATLRQDGAVVGTGTCGLEPG